MGGAGTFSGSGGVGLFWGGWSGGGGWHSPVRRPGEITSYFHSYYILKEGTQ